MEMSTFKLLINILNQFVYYCIMKNSFYILALTLLLSCNKDKKVDYLGDFQLNNLELAISFPPVENKSDRKNTKTILADLNVKKIRFAEEWKFREPTQGDFKWGPLDDRLNWANDAGLEVLLTIQSNAPDWACTGLKNDNSCVFDTTAFKTYIETLLQRYPDKIAKIQFGNEWQSDYWYIGSSEEFTTANNILYTAVQDYSPSTEVVLGGFTTISLRYLAGCSGKVDSFKDDEGNIYDQAFLDDNCNGAEVQAVFDKITYILANANYDYLDLHLYDDVEKWDIYVYHFETMVNKPIIVTEFGGPNHYFEDKSQEYHAAQLYKYIETLDNLNISEAYFFKLVEGSKNKAHKDSGLIKNLSNSKKRSYYVLKRFNQ